MENSQNNTFEMDSKKSRVVVLGGGRWGITLASLAAQHTDGAREVEEVTILISSRTEHGLRSHLDYFKSTGRTRMFPDPEFDMRDNDEFKGPEDRLGLELPKSVSLVGSYEEAGAAIEQADLVIIALKSEIYRTTVQALSPYFRAGQIVCSATKSLFYDEATGELNYWSDLLWEDLNAPEVVIISGPNLSNEIMNHKPAVTLVASRSSYARNYVADIIKTSFFSVQTSSDVRGVQLVSVLKNTYAMAAGALRATNAGRNALGAFAVKVQIESTNILERAGANFPYETATGLAGLGDLLATMLSEDSRNATVGRLLAEGWRGIELEDELDRLGKGNAEGLLTTKQLLQLSRRLGAEAPVVEIMHRSLSGAPKTSERLLEHLLSEHGRPAYVVSRELPPSKNNLNSPPARSKDLMQPSSADVVYHRAPRQPKIITEGGKRKVIFTEHSSPNGIMTALTSAWSSQSSNSFWVAVLPFEPEDHTFLKELPKIHKGPWAANGDIINVELVPMPRRLYDVFYGKFAKNIFWPVLHDYPEQIVPELRLEVLEKNEIIKEELWNDFHKANKILADAIIRRHPPESSPIIMVEDYNAWLVPGYIAAERPNARIAFFHHTYLPPAETFRKFIPQEWLVDICQSLARCGSIGVHTPAYAKGLVDLFQQLLPHVTWSNVISAYSEDPHEGIESQIGPARYRPGSRLHDIRNFPTTFSMGAHRGEIVVNPVSVSCHRYEAILQSEEGKKELRRVAAEIGDDIVLFSTARADYTKGLLELVEAFYILKTKLAHNPELLDVPAERVRLVLGAVKPDLEQKPAYRPFVESLDSAVSKLQCAFPGSISYHEKGFSHTQWAPYARRAKVVIFAPGNDGLNTMGQEAERFMATQIPEPSNASDYTVHWWESLYPVLITSPHCGACAQLPGALIADPKSSPEDFAEVLLEAINVDDEERKNRSLRNRSVLGPTSRWLARNLNNLHTVTAAAVRASARGRGWCATEQRWESEWYQYAQSRGVHYELLNQAWSNSSIRSIQERETLREILRKIPLSGDRYDLDVELFVNQALVQWGATILEENLHSEQLMRLEPEDSFERSPFTHETFQKIAWGLGYNPDVREAHLARKVWPALRHVLVNQDDALLPSQQRAELRYVLEETVSEFPPETVFSDSEEAWITERVLNHKGPVLLLLDFDGVCAEFTRKREQTEMSPLRQATLSTLVLMSQIDVALISARPLEELHEVVDVDGLILSGNHGREGKGYTVSSEVHEQVTIMREQVQEACKVLTTYMGTELIQDRGLTLAVNLREVPEERHDHIYSDVKRLLQDSPIVWKDASCEIEGHPVGSNTSLEISKATAVESIIEDTYRKRADEWLMWNPGFSQEEAISWAKQNLLVLCAGDDYGDMPMMVKAQEIAGTSAVPFHVVIDDNDPRLTGGMFVKGGFNEISHYRLRSPRQVFALLQHLIENMYDSS